MYLTYGFLQGILLSQLNANVTVYPSPSQIPSPCLLVPLLLKGSSPTFQLLPARRFPPWLLAPSPLNPADASAEQTVNKQQQVYQTNIRAQKTKQNKCTLNK